jgi:FixJ family two-component response regulator
MDRPAKVPYIGFMKSARETHQPSIAIVDDDESARNAATSLFRSMGFAAAAFASAEAFLESDGVEDTLCLVLDVQMPGMGGLKLQSHLAALGRRIPIVFVTGYSNEGARERALRSGAVCFLTKPFNERDLLDGLHAALTSIENESQLSLGRADDRALGDGDTHEHPVQRR